MSVISSTRWVRVRLPTRISRSTAESITMIPLYPNWSKLRGSLRVEFPLGELRVSCPNRLERRNDLAPDNPASLCDLTIRRDIVRFAQSLLFSHPPTQFT